MLVLDTNVLMYGIGREHALCAPAQELLRAAARGLVTITTTPEVIQEFAHVYASGRPRADAADRALDYVRACGPLLVSVEGDVPHAIELFREHDRLDAFDCLLAAVAIREGAEIVSADRAFAAVAGLAWHDLAGLDVEQL